MKISLIALTLGAALLPLHAADLKPKQQKALIKLYEEEILAHDLYVELGKIHTDIMPLQHIPKSEAVHRKVMAGILEFHGIEMPEPKGNRRFVTKGLDKTFDAWLAEGKKSSAAACRVGVRLEEHDIADLQAAQKQFPESKVPLANLERASGNHLRAFHYNLTARKGSYEPEVMSKKDFDAILAAPHGGPGRRAKGGGAGACATEACPATCPPTCPPTCPGECPQQKKAPAAKPKPGKPKAKKK